nr:hypothetical protein B0A51_00168 [Rachicladosporium sp. CCFEE 5018]
MRLLNLNFELCDFDDSPPPYAILSHTWSENNEDEVSYHDLRYGTKKSLLKLELCRDWTKAKGFEYFWIDTCCIDKRNDAEISYAIRSMWRWYSEAAICFVYLSDLSMKRKRDVDADWRDALKDCRWFTRGWTLQELMASKKVEFHTRNDRLGSREDLLLALKSITGINLGDQLPNHATRLGWVTKRTTKRPEDRAYCMLGICDVSLDPRYGEGGNAAWRRLEDAIAHRYGTIALEVRGATANKDHREMVLEALRFDALETRRRTVKAALAKTCKWILKHPACAKWLKLEHKFFWIKGKPGAGKSVLIKYLDQHVTRGLKKSNAVGLYFYFNARGERLEKSFLGLYRSLLVQIIDLVPELMHELDTLDTQFDVSQLQRVLASAISSVSRQIWIFIDALDECREGDVRELIDFLDGLEAAEVYVCLASRHYPIVKVPTKLQLVLEEIDEHKQDLSTYIEKLDLQGEELARMQHDIVAKANGIFLWVVLVVGILQKDVERGRFHAMQSRLREIPAGLPELFKTIILRDDEYKDEFLLCLRWILYAFRPLTLREWYFAMMAGTPTGSLDWHEEITDQRMETFLLSSSKGLAELAKGKTITPQFIHESVRDFLIHDRGFEQICGADGPYEGISHEQLKQCCLWGVVFDLPRELEQHMNKKQLLTDDERTALRRKYPFAEYATTYILHHADRAAVQFPQENFLTREFMMKDWLDRANAFQKNKPDVYCGAPSLGYLCAEKGLTRLIPRPTEALSPDVQQRYRMPLIAAIANSNREMLEILVHDMDVPNFEKIIQELGSKSKFVLSPRSLLVLPWRWAVSNGLVHLSGYLLKGVPKDEMDSDDHPQGNALHWASKQGNAMGVRALLAAGADVDSRNDGFALSAAIGNGHVHVVQILLDAGIDVNRQHRVGGSALYSASEKGNENLVQMLLRTGADVNAQGSNCRTALLAATTRGNEKIVQLLLDAGAHVNPRGECLESPLYAASANGHETLVQMLLDAGASVNDHRDGGHGLALYAAISNKHEKIVPRLLSAGADVNIPTWDSSALQLASITGGESVVQALLDAGADVNAQGLRGSALQVASTRVGRGVIVVQMLLRAGADVNAWGPQGSALQLASKNFFEGGVLEILLDAGADVNAQGPAGSALQLASEHGSEEAVQILLDMGADVNAQGPRGSALQLASKTYCNEKRVRALLDAGANINDQGPQGSALQIASKCNNKEGVQMLLDAGADIDAQDLLGSALHMASSHSHTRIVQILLNAGADVNAQGGWYCDAMRATSKKRIWGLASMLEDAKADINAQTSNLNARHVASLHRKKIVQKLLDAGMEVLAPGASDGALQLAMSNGHEKVVKMLRDAGAED